VAGQFSSPTTRLGTHANGVLFPALAKVETIERRRHAFLSSLRVMASILFPAAWFLHVAAQPIIAIGLGSMWTPARAPLQALVWAATFQALTSCTKPLFLSLGKPASVVVCQTLKLATIGVMVLPILHLYGIAGVAWTMALGSLLSMLLQILLAARSVGAELLQLLSCFRDAGLVSLPVIAAEIAVPGHGNTFAIVVVLLSLPPYLWSLGRVSRQLFSGIAGAPSADPIQKEEVLS
jgi:O-antigen/teichoic acid export membrane protein